MTPVKESKYISISEITGILDISRQTAEIIVRKYIPHTRIGDNNKTIRVKRTDFEAYLKKNEKKPELLKKNA